jgi:hypothetical protein
MNKRGALGEYLKEIMVIVLILISVYLLYSFVTGRLGTLG